MNSSSSLFEIILIDEYFYFAFYAHKEGFKNLLKPIMKLCIRETGFAFNTLLSLGDID